jgi:hypothetical protein
VQARKDRFVLVCLLCSVLVYSEGKEKEKEKEKEGNVL